MRKSGVMLAIVATIACTGCAGKSMKKGAATDITGFGELNSLETVDVLTREKDLLILDVRSVKEQKTKHEFLKGAVMIPEEELPQHLEEFKAYRDKTVLVACPCGRRSRRASAFLAQNGFQRVYNISPPGIPGLVKIPGAPVEYR